MSPKLKSEVFRSFLSVLVSVLLVSTAVYAATSIGTNVSVEGTLAVGSNSTLTGDIAVNGGDVTTSATTWNFDVGNTGSILFRDGTNTLMTIADGGTAGNVSITGTTTLTGALTTNGGITLGAYAIDGTYFDVAATTGAVILTQQAVGTAPITITGIASGTAPEADINTKNISGSVIDIDWVASTQTGALSGVDVNLANLTNDNTNNVYGVYVNDFTSAGAGGNLYGVYVDGTDWDYGLYVVDAAKFDGDVTLGNAVADTTILNGRVATGSLAGAALALDSSYTYNKLWHIEGTLSDWSGFNDDFIGTYFRFRSEVDSPSSGTKNLMGMEVNISSTNSTGALQGLYVETQYKTIAAAETIGKLQGIESNLSLYNQTQTANLTTWGTPFYGTIGIGSGYADAALARLHGMVIETRDGAGATKALGYGLYMVNKGEGTQTWTKGIYMNMGAATGVELNGAMTTGIDITGAGTVTTGIDIGSATTGINFTGTNSSAITLSSMTPGAAAGPLILAGTSASPITTSTAGTNFVQMYTKTTATSGMTRGIYNRVYFQGAGTGTGDSLRSYADVGAAVGTVTGAHISLGMGESTTIGSVSGLGVGVRATLGLPDGALPAGGTYAAMMPEIYSFGAGGLSDPSAVTELSFIRAVNDGSANGIAKVDDKAVLFSLQGFTAGTGNMVAAGTGMSTVTGTIRIKIGGTTYYLPYYSSPGQ